MSWDAFWPNAAATLLGVVLGVPSALWLERQLARQRRAREELERAARRRDVARLLIETLRNHEEHMLEVKGWEPGHILIMSEVDLASWPALQDEAFDLFDSIELRRDLARHFELVDRIVRMSEQRTERALGSVRRHSGLEQSWFSTIKRQSSKAAEQARTLIGRLEQLSESPVRHLVAR